jgi:hypothetical protein
MTDSFSGTTVVDSVNSPSAPVFVSHPFAWRYSGSGSGNSQYCRATKVEVEADFVAFGVLNGGIAWGLVMRDEPSGTTYYSSNAFHSFDSTTPANGMEFITGGVKTVIGPYAHSGTIKAVFNDIGDITDGNNVRLEVYAVSINGPLAITDFSMTTRIRPVANLID